MLSDSLLAQYTDKFFGFGSWEAKIWFIGIEEAGGWTEWDVRNRLDGWKRQRQKVLEDAPAFYPLCGNQRWHGKGATIQATWKQLIRMLLLARGGEDGEGAILEYQRALWGTHAGETCLAELLPLPSPSVSDWN